MTPRFLPLLIVTSIAAVAQPPPESHPPIGHQPRRPAGYVPVRYAKTPADLLREESDALRARAQRVSADVQATIDKGPFRADHASIATHSCPEWLLDAKFGMFIDWGPWSVAGWAPQAEKATYPDWYEWGYPVIAGQEFRRLRFDGSTTEPLTADAPFVSGKVPVADYASE